MTAKKKPETTETPDVVEAGGGEAPPAFHPRDLPWLDRPGAAARLLARFAAPSSAAEKGYVAHAAAYLAEGFVLVRQAVAPTVMQSYAHRPHAAPEAGFIARFLLGCRDAPVFAPLRPGAEWTRLPPAGDAAGTHRVGVAVAAANPPRDAVFEAAEFSSLLADGETPDAAGRRLPLSCGDVVFFHPRLFVRASPAEVWDGSVAFGVFAPGGAP